MKAKGNLPFQSIRLRLPNFNARFFIFAEIMSDIRLDGQELIKAKVSIPRVTGNCLVKDRTLRPRHASDFETQGLLDWKFLKTKYCDNLARSFVKKR